MQTGSSETAMGSKSGKTSYVSIGQNGASVDMDSGVGMVGIGIL
jgi:hypothetical protein